MSEAFEMRAGINNLGERRGPQVGSALAGSGRSGFDVADGQLHPARRARR